MDSSVKCKQLETIDSNAYHGQFLIDSLFLGQGITLGNQLRRVLLSDLGGVAISAVRIIGITHEFSTIPGVREDILEILLNLKGIVFEGKTKKPLFARLKIQGPSVVTADAIKLPANLKIVNPNHYIATISTSNILEIEFKLEYGTGYKLASQTSLDESFKMTEFLETDAVFMPVEKVDFKIESVYDSMDNVTERMLLDIWTNGSISPKEALKSAINITVSFFSQLTIDETLTRSSENNLLKDKEDSNLVTPYTNITIEDLQFSVRAYNCLKKAQINTVGDLLHYSPKKLQKLKNFGKKSADEVFYTLKNKLGIILK